MYSYLNYGTLDALLGRFAVFLPWTEVSCFSATGDLMEAGFITFSEGLDE
jgi:hypothetical protein